MFKHQEITALTQLEKNLQQAIAKYKSEGNDTSGRSLENAEKGASLEKVVRDMATVFSDLKTSISLVKRKEKSVHNVEKELELIYKKQEETSRKEEEKNAGQAKQKAAKKNNNKPKSQPNKQPIKNNNRNNTQSKARPNTAPNVPDIVVTTLKFPSESQKSRDGSPKARSADENLRSKSTAKNPTLRKPQQKLPETRVASVPTPREIYNPLGILKDEVEKAIRERKTFTIKGQFPAVRRALIRRGWIEKYHPNYRLRLNEEIKKYQQMSVEELLDLLRVKDIAENVKKMIRSKLLKDHQVDLYWDHAYDAFKECPDGKKLTLINKCRREPFSYTSKQGLCQAAREAHWLQIPGVAKINHPRCYVLTKGGDTKSFLKEFGLTAAISLLKWVVKNNITGESRIVSETGKIPLRVFDFAITECYKYMKSKKHQDIDEEIRDALEAEWNEFLEQYYKAVHVGNHFKLTDKRINALEETKNMVRKANYLLNQIKEFMPYFDMDGYMNIWILKPTNSSRGEGIHICRTLQYILEIIRKNPNRRYVIQKYIERPLLIHDTKFDIRQWFLVSSSYPLVIWIYKVCYLRFSSQTYNLRKLHESIHLTNNSVQAKYQKHGTKDPLLPEFGMWDSKHFKNYLSDIGYPNIFEEVIYPGMKECITGAMIAHRDKMDKRKNCFELYGADFMLSEHFEPWMLEINSNPALYASTPVTARLCPEVQEDVIKVVIDNARNPEAGTGNFELIYRENPETQASIRKQPKLEVLGSPVPENYFHDIPSSGNARQLCVLQPKKFETPDPGKILMQTGYTMKEALKNLLEIVKREKIKRRSRREKSIEVKSDADEASIQTHSEVISLYQNSFISHNLESNPSNCDSEEEITLDEAETLQKMLCDLKTLHAKKDVISSLIKVVDSLKHSKKDQ